MMYNLGLITTSLLAGSLLMGTVGLRSALADIDVVMELRVRQRMIRALRHVMPALMVTNVLSLGLAAAPGHSKAAQFLAVAGFTLCAVVLAITLTVHAPLNRTFLTWGEHSLPPNFRALINRWNRWDSIRAAVAAAALLAITCSTMG